MSTKSARYRERPDTPELAAYKVRLGLRSSSVATRQPHAKMYRRKTKHARNELRNPV